MDLGQSERSHHLSQPIQAVKDRAPLGSIEDYDPLWVQKGNVNPKIVEDFKSRISFDTLFSYSVIRPGDVLTLKKMKQRQGLKRARKIQLFMAYRAVSTQRTMDSEPVVPQNLLITAGMLNSTHYARIQLFRRISCCSRQRTSDTYL